MTKQKVLLAITKSNWGGAQKYVHDLAVSLLQEGFEVAVAVGGSGLPHAKTGRLKIELERCGVRTITLTKFSRDISPFLDLAAFWEFLQMIRCERPDVLHNNSSKMGGIGAVAGRFAGVPNVVFTSHGLAYDEDRPLIARIAIWFLTWMTFLFSHHVILLSRDTAARARRFPFCSRKITLIYNGVKPQTLKERAIARKTLVQNFSDEMPWIGTIAELTKNKYLDRLIRAAGILFRRGLNFRLCIVGVGEERSNLETIIREENMEEIVALAGFVPEGAAYLKAFDIFALVSVKEGLPYVLMEAGYASLPIIGSRIHGITDIVEDNETGLLANPGDVTDLADKLERLLQDEPLRRKLGEALRQKVQDAFSVENMIKETIALYANQAPMRPTSSVSSFGRRAGRA